MGEESGKVSSGGELQGQMLDLALTWGWVQDLDLREAKGADQGPAGTLAWLSAEGRLHSDQIAALEQEARALDSTTHGETPTARYRELHSGAARPDVLTSARLSHWGRFEGLRLIGEGGMARIFKAFDPRLRRHVALKILRVDDPEMLHRFILEAQVQALVDHEHVCRVFEAGNIEGQAYIAMQLIEGETLKEALEKLSLKEMAGLMVQVCEGVHAAHRHGLIHRDIKPSNLMMEQDEEGRAKAYVLDFGLARGAATESLTVTGFVMGTMTYMPPEQARGEVHKMDRRVDVYALGATLCHLFTGAPPFGDAQGMEAMRKCIYEDPPPPRKRNPELPRDLETIILKCLEKDPARRYDTARALGDDLQRWVSGDPILARSISTRERALRFTRRNKLTVGVAAVALLAVFTTSWFAITSRLNAAAQARWAQHFGQEAERLESLMRYGKLLPAHDLRHERSAVEARLQALEREITGAGSLARGPGAYALGRTWLALSDPGRARLHLQRALDTGFREPGVNYALGRACGMLYQKELEEAQRIPEPDARQARIKELERGLKAEAVAFLRAGRGSELEPPEYQEGQLALVDGRYQEAIRSARSAFGRAPWFFEAKRLEAEGQLAAARVETGPGAAEKHLEEAAAAIETARTIAPSDPAILELESNRCHEKLGLIVRAASDPKAVVEEQNSACRSWEIVEPYSSKPSIRIAIAASEMSRFNTRNPTERQLWMDIARKRLKVAQESDPSNAEVLAAGVSLLRIEAQQEEQAGKNPLDTLTQAVQLARRARDLSTTSINLNLLLLRSYTTLLRVQIGRGMDPTGVFIEAKKLAEDLMGRYPNVATYPAAYGLLQVELADAESQRGGDPRKLIADAIPKLELAHRLNPQDPAHTYGIANARLVRAEYEDSMGRDADQDVQSCKQLYIELVNRAEGFPHYHTGLAMALELEARGMFQKQLDPTGRISEARARLRVVDRMLPNYWMSDVLRARLDILEGRLLRDRTSSGHLHFDKAEKSLLRLAKIRPGQPEIRIAMHLLRQAREEARHPWPSVAEK